MANSPSTNNDTLIYSLISNQSLNTLSGDDVVTIKRALNSQIFLGDGADKLTIGDISTEYDKTQWSNNLTIKAGSGDDVVVVNGLQNGSLYGESGFNQLIVLGGGVNVKFYGGNDVDHLTYYGFSRSYSATPYSQREVNNVSLFGGDGRDTLTVNANGGRAEGGAGTDYFYLSGNNILAYGGAERDSFYSTDNRNTNLRMYGGEGGDFFRFGSFKAGGESKNNMAYGENGEDSFFFDSYSTGYIADGGNDADTFTLRANAVNNTLLGGAGDDSMYAYGNALNPFGVQTTYSGRDNIMNGGAGNDKMYGHNDIYVMDENSGRDKVFDAKGTFRVGMTDMRNLANFDIRFNRSTNVLTLQQSGAASVEFKTDGTRSNFNTLTISDADDSSVISASVLNQVIAKMQTFNTDKADLQFVATPNTSTDGLIQFVVGGQVAASVNVA